MESKLFGKEIVLRLDEGDELLSAVEQTCRGYGVSSARVTGIGALKRARLRVLNRSGDGFCFQDINESMEITGINGNVTKDGDGLMIHLHLSAANESFQPVGGHVMSCIIANTAELWIVPVQGGILSRAQQAQGLLRKIEFEESGTMNEVIQNMLDRRSIRKYKDEQISDEQLELILQAGQYAPNAGGRQSPIFAVTQDRETIDAVGRINMACLREIAGIRPGDAGGKKPNLPKETLEASSAFYNAPTLVTLFAPKDWHNFTLDCAVAAENMLLAAASLGVGSCLIARAAETFSTEEGKKIQAQWGLGEEMEARVHVLLGYASDPVPAAKPRREGRIIRV